MRTKILLLLCVFINFAAIASNTDVRSAERDLKNAQKEVSQLASQKRAIEAKLQKAEADLQEANAKIEETQDKPKSLPYKNAVKKAETSQQKIEDLRSSLQSVETEIETKNAELLNYQQILQSAQQSRDDDAAAKQQAKEDAKLAIQREKDSIKLAKQQAKEEKSAQYNYGEEEKAVTKPTYQTKEDYQTSSSSDGAKQTSSTDGKLPPWLFWVGIIFLGICAWFEFRKRHRCPHCGKWFTLESEGDTRVWDHDSRGKISKRGVRKKYRCSNCKQSVQFIQWFSK